VIGIPTRLEDNDQNTRANLADPAAALPEAGAAERPVDPPGSPDAPSSPDPPGSLDPAGSLDPVTRLGAARLTAEVLSSLARVSEEMVVATGPDGSVTIVVATEGPGPPPDLGRLPETAA
jgi:hypothetical protein